MIALADYMQPSIRHYFYSRQQEQPTKFVDFFCGFGGASVGAAAAGLDVVLAVDSSPTALEIHKQNHPRAKHACIELPSDENLQLPAADTPWHLHGSPPCTSVSTANQIRNIEDRGISVKTVEWFIEYAVKSTAVSWSLEQVANPIIMACVRKLKKKLSRDKFDYEVFNFSRLGVPQNRRRLIAGNPEIVARLRRAPVSRRSVCDVIERPRGTHIRNSKTQSQVGPAFVVNGKRKIEYTPKTDDDYCWSVTGPSYCVLASYPLRWATPNSEKKVKLRCLNVDETLRLQCFPPDYVLPRKKVDCYRGIGNALPPTIMQQMLTPEPKHLAAKCALAHNKQT